MRALVTDDDINKCDDIDFNLYDIWTHSVTVEVSDYTTRLP